MTAGADPATDLAREVRRAARRAGAARTLLLDLDGTLAPIASTPRQAAVPGETLESLRKLVRQGWTVAVISGRPAAQIRRLVPLRGVWAFGSHGREGSWDGNRRRRSGRPDPRLRQLAGVASRLARSVPGAYVEEKPAGLALHDRNVPAGHLRGWRRQVQDLLRAADLEGLDVLRGRRVVEIRARGEHKGRVVEALLRGQSAARTDPSLVGLGDDWTDEDMFRALEGHGLGVRVGRRRFRTLARRRLPSPAAVGRFLRLLTEDGEEKEASR